MYTTIAPNGARVIVRDWSTFVLQHKDQALAIIFNDDLFKELTK